MRSSIDIVFHNEERFKFLWEGANLNIDLVPEKNTISLPYEVEDNCYTLRSRYINFISAKGYEKIHGNCLIDLFKIRDDFSYWWMTEFVEKQHYGRHSPIYSVLKLMILDDFLSKEKGKIKRITINGIKEDYVAKILSKWSHLNGIELIGCNNENKKNKLRDNFLTIGSFLKAIAFLFWLYLRNFRFKPLNIKKAYTLSFWGYLLNFNGAEIEKSGFRSQYWTELVRYFEKENIQVSWMHIWLKSSSSSSISLKESFNGLKKFMGNYPNSFHHIINGKISFKILFSSLRDFLSIRKLSDVIKDVSFNERNGGMDYMYAYQAMFAKDTKSAQGMWNILCLNLFETLLAKLPFQKVGFYLQENASWEAAFLYAWRRYKHGDIIGIPHATIRFWDLRYFTNENQYSSIQSKPKPDLIAVNSPYAKKELMSFITNQNDIIELEALRYLHLSKSRLSKVKKSNKSKLKLLIAGDYDVNSSENLLKLFTSLPKCTLEKFNIFYKGHPGSENGFQFDFGSYGIKLVNEQLDKLIFQCDVVCTTNSTSIAVEGFSIGIEVLSHLNWDALNMSPLKGMSGIKFFTETTELDKMLIEISKKNFDMGINERKPNDYFYTDLDINKWKSILTKYLSKS